MGHFGEARREDLVFLMSRFVFIYKEMFLAPNLAQSTFNFDTGLSKIML